MKCSICDGSIDTESVVPIKTGCFSHDAGHKCNDCDRVYWATDGEPTYNRKDQAFFFVDGENVFVPKDEENDFANKRKEASTVS